MTFKSATIDPTSGSVTGTYVIPNDPSLVGSLLTLFAFRSSSTSTPHTPSCTSGGTFEHLVGTKDVDGVLIPGVGLLVGGGSTLFGWRKKELITNADLGATISITSASAASSRWEVGGHYSADVGPDDDVTVVTTGSSGTSLVLPAATPAVGSQGGRAVHCAVSYLNNNTAGIEYTSSEVAIRAQRTFTSASGVSPSMALADRPFTGSSALASAAVSLSTSAVARAGVTVLYSGSVVAPVTADATAPVTAAGGDKVPVSGTATGGTAPYSHSFAPGQGLAVELYGTGASRWYAAPVGGGQVEIVQTATDSLGASDVDVVSTTISERQLVPLLTGPLASGWVSSGSSDPVAVLENGTSSTDYLSSPSGSGAAQAVKLGAIPGSARTAGLQVWVEARLDAAATATVTVRLLEGATIRGTKTFSPSTSRDRFLANFTPTEVNAIGDLGNCSITIAAAIS